MTLDITHFPNQHRAAGDGHFSRPRTQPFGLNGFEMFLLCFLMASFAYEIPLAYLTSRYRLNPRLFDVAALSLIGYWVLFGAGRGWKITLDNLLLKPWLTLVGVFCFMAFFTIIFVPFNLFMFSGWFALRYVFMSVLLLIVLSAPLTEVQKRRLLWIALLGGTWVSFYGLLQLLGIASNVRVLPTGFEVEDIAEGAINSTLGVSYFHTGQFGVISGIIGMTLFRTCKGFQRTVAGVLGPFAMIPAVTSGSRAGFIGLLVALVALGSQREYRKYLTTFVMTGVVAAVISFAYAGSLTEARQQTGAATSAENRFLQGAITIQKVQDTVGPRLWLLGGGFYVTPIGANHRIGFGVHNIFLFPLEQAGLFGFAASIWVWWRLLNSLRPRSRIGENTTDAYFRTGMFAYLVSLFVVGWGGQIFWLGFGNENLGVYQFLLFGLAMMSTRTGGDRPEVAARPAPVEITSPYLAAAAADGVDPTP